MFPWQTPILFHPDYRFSHSIIEELLASWLCACQAIQPSDILKLRPSNFAYEFNRSGRLLMLECTYYKGRSGTPHRPELMMSSEPWTKALFQYLSKIEANTLLFGEAMKRKYRMTRLNEESCHSPLGLLHKLWNIPNLQNQIHIELQKHGSTPIFLNAMLALKHSGPTYCIFRRNTGLSRSHYKEMISRPLPVEIFTLTHIKNTSVHARSDMYRDGDLINYNSHSSKTEKQ